MSDLEYYIFLGLILVHLLFVFYMVRMIAKFVKAFEKIADSFQYASYYLSTQLEKEKTLSKNSAKNKET